MIAPPAMHQSHLNHRPRPVPLSKGPRTSSLVPARTHVRAMHTGSSSRVLGAPHVSVVDVRVCTGDSAEPQVVTVRLEMFRSEPVIVAYRLPQLYARPPFFYVPYCLRPMDIAFPSGLIFPREVFALCLHGFFLSTVLSLRDLSSSCIPSFLNASIVPESVRGSRLRASSQLRRSR